MDLFKSLGKAMSFTADDDGGTHTDVVRGSASPSKSKRKASPESAGDSTTKKKKKSLADKIMSANPFSLLNPFDTAEADAKAAIDAKEAALGTKKSTAGARKATVSSGSPTAGAGGGGGGSSSSPASRPAGSRSRSDSLSARAAKAPPGGTASSAGAAREGRDGRDLLSATAKSAVHDDDGKVNPPLLPFGVAASAPSAKRSGVFGTAAAAAAIRPQHQQQLSSGLSSTAVSSDHPWFDKPKSGGQSAAGGPPLPLQTEGGGSGMAYHGLTSLQGTSRVRYQCSTLVQGNMVHFVIVVVDDLGLSQNLGSPRDGVASSSGGKCLALIGLLEPLGAVRSSSKAILQRCAAIRKLERVRISPREREMSLALLFDKSDPLLVDPEQAPVLGLILPFLRPLQGVSTVDGYRAEFWVACDASGMHKAPLFDVEGPIDELNQAAVLRLRCHDMRREDIRPQGAQPIVDAATQTVVHEARSMLQRDFDAEFEQLKSDQKREVDSLKVEVRALRIELENCRHDAAASAKSAQATEGALVAEIETLKRQLAARVSSTQTNDGAVAVSTQVSIAASEVDSSSDAPASYDPVDDGNHEVADRPVVLQTVEERIPRRLRVEPSRDYDSAPLHSQRQGFGGDISRSALSPDGNLYRPDSDPFRRIHAPMVEPPVQSLSMGVKTNLATTTTTTTTASSVLTPLQYSQASRARETEDVLAKVRDRIAKSEAYLKKSAASSAPAVRSVR